MKLLFLSMHYKPEPCDTRTSQLAEAMAARGHQTVATTSFPNYPFGKVYEGYRQRIWDKKIINGVEVVRLPMFPDHSRSAKRRTASYLSFGASAALLAPLATRKPDVIWIHHPPLSTGLAGWFLSRLKRVPFVYEVHDLWPETLVSTGMVKEGRVTRAIRRTSRFLYKRAAAIVVTSPGMKSHLVAQGVHSSKIHVLPQWADESLADPVQRDQEFGERHNLVGKFNVLFTGNVGIAQGLDTLLDAAARVSDLVDVQVVIVGDGVEFERLKTRVHREGLANVRLLGQYPKEQMPDFFAWSDGLLAHLQEDPLFAITIPSKVQTYMAAGKPVLCGLSGDGADVVRRSGSGLVFPPNSAEEMADAIRTLRASTADQRMDWARAARAAYEAGFSVSALAGSYERLFEQVAASGWRLRRGAITTQSAEPGALARPQSRTDKQPA